MLSSLFQISHSFISYYSREDYEWIGVVRPEERNFEENENLAGLLDEWEVLKNEHPLDISTERIFELARKYHVTGGKWMFWAETGYRIDHLWAIVAKGIVSLLVKRFFHYKPKSMPVISLPMDLDMIQHNISKTDTILNMWFVYITKISWILKICVNLKNLFEIQV